MKISMKYTYFVAYIFVGSNNVGTGNCEAFSDKKINTIGAIRELEKKLKGESQYESVTVSNIQLLSKKVEVKNE